MPSSLQLSTTQHPLFLSGSPVPWGKGSLCPTRTIKIRGHSPAQPNSWVCAHKLGCNPKGVSSPTLFWAWNNPNLLREKSRLRPPPKEMLWILWEQGSRWVQGEGSIKPLLFSNQQQLQGRNQLWTCQMCWWYSTMGDSQYRAEQQGNFKGKPHSLCNWSETWQRKGKREGCLLGRPGAVGRGVFGFASSSKKGRFQVSAY